ncbi:MAG: L-threonylcarbamoyladenylate synthase [Dehalococcoidia bacterium]|nr:L-threonylcarbamoyladenylate synthase [Dehalococcoidia bacterium]MDD5494857.1 L-threonylcarbamoyladenylate synthase [Dehalococcoidia bacterium]
MPRAKKPAFEHLPPRLLKQVTQAVDILRNGGVVAYPTDTVYGLGSDIYEHEAVRRVFNIKGRPLSLPLPVLIADIKEVDLLADEISPFARALMERFWPGGLTIILRKSAALESLVLAGSHKIGIRLPDHAVPRILVSELGRPIVGTSANLHDRETTLTAGEVRSQLGNNVDLIIDAGKCRGGTESTIVDTTVEPPGILRRGIISEKAIMDLYVK